MNYQIHRSWILKIFVTVNSSRDHSQFRYIHVDHGSLRHIINNVDEIGHQNLLTSFSKTRLFSIICQGGLHIQKYPENGSGVAQKFNLIYWNKRVNVAQIFPIFGSQVFLFLWRNSHSHVWVTWFYIFSVCSPVKFWHIGIIWLTTRFLFNLWLYRICITDGSRLLSHTNCEMNVFDWNSSTNFVRILSGKFQC